MFDVEIFLCYDHTPQDEPLVEELKKRLKILKRFGLINAIWHDQLVEPGQEPDREIDRHLNSDQIILLLISPDFLASDLCDSNMKQAMKRHEHEEARVIAVILRPVGWQEASFSKLQVLPTNRMPVTLWPNSDSAWLDVEAGIKSAAESIRKNVGDYLPDSSISASTMTSDTIVPVPGSSGKISENVTVKPPGNLPAAVRYSRALAPNAPEFDFTLVRTFVEHFGPVATVAFSPDGEHLVSDSSDKKIKIWDRLAKHSLLTFSSQAEAVYSVVFSPDNRRLASGSDDGRVNIWDAQNGRLVYPLTSHAEPIASVAFGLNMKVMSGSDDGIIKIWNIPGGTLDKTLIGHKGPISSIALSTDGKILVSGSHDKTIKIWDISTGEVLKTLWGHDDKVSSVALSTDGKLLVSGSNDTTLKIWEVSTGEMLKVCSGHTKEVLSVAFHPNGQIIASGSYDKTIRIWQTPSVPVRASWTPSPAPPPVNPTGIAPSSKSPFLDGGIPGSISSDQDDFKQRMRDFLKPRFLYTRSSLFILGIIANILGATCIGVWIGRVAPSYANETAWVWLIISLVSSECAWWLFNYSGNKSLQGFLTLVLSIIWGFVGKAFATLIGAGASIGFCLMETSCSLSFS